MAALSICPSMDPVIIQKSLAVVPRSPYRGDGSRVDAVQRLEHFTNVIGELIRRDQSGLRREGRIEWGGAELPKDEKWRNGSAPSITERGSRRVSSVCDNRKTQATNTTHGRG